MSRKPKTKEPNKTVITVEKLNEVLNAEQSRLSHLVEDLLQSHKEESQNRVKWAYETSRNPNSKESLSSHLAWSDSYDAYEELSKSLTDLLSTFTERLIYNCIPY